MGQTKILVVEDDAPIRRGLCDALRYAGYAVEECPTGDEALDRAYATSPDLLNFCAGRRVTISWRRCGIHISWPDLSSFRRFFSSDDEYQVLPSNFTSARPA